MKGEKTKQKRTAGKRANRAVGKGRSAGAKPARKPSSRRAEGKSGSETKAPRASKPKEPARAKPGRTRRTTRAGTTRKAKQPPVAGTPAGIPEPRLTGTAAQPALERVVEEARALAEQRAQRPAFEERYELPESYGKDRIVLMVRDPYWIHAYWELGSATVGRVLRDLGKAAVGARRVLRVYSGDAGVGRAADYLFDIAVTPEARNWYVNVGGPGRTYRIELGLLTRDRTFVCLVSSNSVTLPPDRMSDLVDEEWRTLSPQYYGEMYALSGGLSLTGPALASPGLHERLARRLGERLASPVFSPGVGVGVGAEELEAPFWLRLDADLVVYGATVPGSRLTVTGGDCALREDGTFAFRCHLPDGKKDITVSSRSQDDTREETIELTVTRSTR